MMTRNLEGQITKTTERRRIEFVASSQRRDRCGDIIVTEGLRFAEPLPLVVHHDREKRVGTVSSLRRDVLDDGMPAVFGVGLLDPPGNPLADDAWRAIQDGTLAAVSIGFDGAFEERPSGRIFHASELKEVSIVKTPACEDCRITSHKAAMPGVPARRARWFRVGRDWTSDRGKAAAARPEARDLLSVALELDRLWARREVEEAQLRRFVAGGPCSMQEVRRDVRRAAEGYLARLARTQATRRALAAAVKDAVNHPHVTLW